MGRKQTTIHEMMKKTLGLFCLITLFTSPAHAWWMCRYTVLPEQIALFGYSLEEHQYVPIMFANKGDTLYLLREKDGELAVQKLNGEWIEYETKNGNYSPLYVNVGEVQFDGFANPGNSPYLDDVELLSIPFQLFPSIPNTPKKWPIIVAFLLSILFWCMGFFFRENKPLVWSYFTVHLLLCVILFIHYYMSGQELTYHWFIDDVGGFVRSTLGELAFALVAITTIAGAVMVSYRISEEYNLDTFHLFGYLAAVLYFLVYFVLDLFSNFSNRYSNYFFFALMGLQIVILIIKIIKNPKKTGCLLLSFTTLLTAIIPIVYVILDFFVVWLLGMGWVGAFQTILEEGFW